MVQNINVNLAFDVKDNLANAENLSSQKKLAQKWRATDHQSVIEIIFKLQ